MNKGKVLKITLPLLIIAGVVFGAYYLWFRQSATPAKETRTVKVVKGDIAPTLDITGTVVSENETGVNFKTSGELIDIKLKVGDTVEVGQELAKIDDTELQRQVKIAKANRSSAYAKYNQTKSDSRSDSYDIRIQAAAVTQAKENYQEALDNLEQSTLKSPIVGTVLAINASVGEQVAGTSSSGAGGQSTSGAGQTDSSSTSSSSTDFMVIADLSKLLVEASVDQVDIPKIAKDQNITITLDAMSGTEFKGKVVNIDPIANNTQDVITYNIKTSIESPDPKIQLGMTADLKIDLGEHKDVLLVPNLAVRSQDGSKVVQKMIDGTPTDVTVEVGLSDEENTEITSGLLEGDEIVVNVFSGTGQAGQGQESRGMGMPIPGMGRH